MPAETGGDKAGKRKSLTFGLAGKPSKRKRGAVGVQVKEKEVKKIYVNSLSQKKLRKIGAGEKKKLVIPLKEQNWEKKQDGDSNKKDSSSQEAGAQKVAEAPQGLVPNAGQDKAAYGLQHRKKNEKDSEPKDSNDANSTEKAKNTKGKSKPMLLMNQIPGMDKYSNDTDKFRYDVDMRPEESSLEDYDRIPVEDFGAAMLRGMGWKPGAKIGVGQNAQHVEPIQFLRRGYRQGLGADDALVALKNAKKERRFIRPGEKRGIQQPKIVKSEDGRRRHYQKIGEKLVTPAKTELEPSALVEFISGPHKGLFGVVEKMAIKAGGGSCYVSLKVGGAIVKATNSHLKVHDPRYLPKDHPAFNTKRTKSLKSGDTSGKKKKKVKPITWVRPNIRIRVTSKSLGGGQYYSKKGIVYDVVSRFTFTVLMTKSDKLVEDVLEKNVETALPKAGGKVMVVIGINKGQVGTLLERNSKLQKCVVQLDEDLQTFKCGFDDIAEYVPQ